MLRVDLRVLPDRVFKLLRLFTYGALSVDNVITTVNVECLAGDEPCRVMGQKCGCDADVIDADQAVRRRLCLGLIEQRVKFGNARGGARRQWPRRNGVNANALRAQLGLYFFALSFR